VADLVLGIVVAALGGLLLAGAREISFGAGYDHIGPRFFPYAVGAGLIVLGALLAMRSLIGRTPMAETEDIGAPEAVDWLPLGLLGAALLLNILLLDRAGFVIASMAQFWLVARAFRSRKPVRDALVALLLSVIVYYAFSRGLGLSLPAGILADIS